MSLNVDSLPVDAAEFQAYLDELRYEQLPTLGEALEARARELQAPAANDPHSDALQRLQSIKDQVVALRAEIAKRDSDATAARVEQAAEAHRRALADLSKTIFGGSGDTDAEDTDSGTDDSGTSGDATVEGLAETFAKVLTRGMERAEVVVASGRDLNKHVRNMPLGAIGRRVDPSKMPARKEAVLVASADIPGVAKNGRVAGIEQLVKLMGDRASMMSVTHGNQNRVAVAKLQRDHAFRLSLDSTPDEVNEVLTAATDTDALVAAGGWCSPSEVSYDFFNIVAESGLLDIPTVGVLNRGGFRWPTSPAISSIFGSDALWTWTEDDDISAAEDGGQTKTCARVPCAGFDEVRAECDGLCVTAGNLTDYAYPELIANYLRLVMAARAHVTNQSVIAQLEAASDAASYSPGNGENATSALLSGLELHAVDYRNRFRMSGSSILEGVLPEWALGTIRADLANRANVALMSVTNGQIADWFNERQIRMQFVQDWQSGFSGEPIGAPNALPTAWPSSVDAMLYAPGTFVRGQALQLNLGVVRDSTLNETNDHTAAWMEDCYAVAKVGHESRLVSIDLCASGETGGMNVACGS